VITFTTLGVIGFAFLFCGFTVIFGIINRTPPKRDFGLQKDFYKRKAEELQQKIVQLSAIENAYLQK